MSRKLGKKFYPYVVQIGNNKEILFVNFANSIQKAFNYFTFRHTHIRDSVLREDLHPVDTYFMDVRKAKRACLRMIRNLEQQGYEVIAGSPLYNAYWQVYVIEIDGDPKHLYVGQTNYPVEKRLQQHIYKFNPARVLLNYDMFDLAMDHAKHLPVYRSNENSLDAEERLAEELRAKGYTVEGGH